MTSAGEPIGRAPARRMWTLERSASLRLLGSVAWGRVVFTEHALPALRLVNHVIDEDTVIIRTRLGASVLGVVGEVVVYQADAIDPEHHTGWSVVLTGWARRVVDPDQITRYQRHLRPWVDLDQAMDQIIHIEPEIVTGYTLTEPQDSNATKPGSTIHTATSVEVQ